MRASKKTTAWDDIRCGTRSIEHWYGIPDAALPDGVQNFPASYSYNDESDCFRYAGRLSREADPRKAAGSARRDGEGQCRLGAYIRYL